MKRVSAVFLTIFLVFTLSLMSISSAAPPALAEENHTTVTVTVLKKGLTAYSYSTTVANDTVGIAVDMNNRDNGRFDRFCGDFKDVDLTSGSGTADCEGKGPWSILIEVTSIGSQPLDSVRITAT